MISFLYSLSALKCKGQHYLWEIKYKNYLKLTIIQTKRSFSSGKNHDKRIAKSYSVLSTVDVSQCYFCLLRFHQRLWFISLHLSGFCI